MSVRVRIELYMIIVIQFFQNEKFCVRAGFLLSYTTFISQVLAGCLLGFFACASLVLDF